VELEFDVDIVLHPKKVSLSLISELLVLVEDLKKWKWKWKLHLEGKLVGKLREETRT